MDNKQQLYQQAKNKTVVLIQHMQKQNPVADLLLNITDYWLKPLDFYLENSDTSNFSANNEFVLVQANKVENLQPNIVLICGFSRGINTIDQILENTTPGGIVVYNADDEKLKEIVENHRNAVKKYPYQLLDVPENITEIFLETDEGNMPIALENKFLIQHLMGVKWICQHIGIDEAEFYEAMAGM